MGDNDVIIHIGLQKTGTTFIQEEIFKRINVRYVRNINFTNLCFKRDKKTIIANEALSGNPYSDKVDRFRVIDALHKLFPNAKIIVGYRDSFDMIKSLYSQYIRNGGCDKYDIGNTIVDYTNNKKYIEHIQSLFKDVFVYNYNTDIKVDKKQFIKRLCDFIGEPVPKYKDKRYRVRLKPYQLKTMAFINRLSYHHEYNPDGKLPEILGKIVRELINIVSNSRMQK